MRKKYPHLMFCIAVLLQSGLFPNSVFPKLLSIKARY